MIEHEAKIKRRVEALRESAHPQPAEQAKAAKLVNRKPESSCFTSPSRETLWQEGMKETMKKPGATLYHPRTEYVLKREAQMPRIPEARPNPGKEIKHRLFEEQHFKLCNRLIDRLNKGYDESKRDSLSRQLVHDASVQYQNRSLLHADPQSAPNRGGKHKRSATTITGQAIEVVPNIHSLNNTSSVDIRIARDSRGSRTIEKDARSRDRENPGPGSSRPSQGPSKSTRREQLGGDMVPG